MPTDLPPNFRGTKPSQWVDVEPEPEDERPPLLALISLILVGTAVAASFVFALVGALFWLGMWFFANLPH